MSALGAVFEWLETTAPARAVSESLMLIAALSAIHLIGFTLVMGGALVANLRAVGVVLKTVPVIGVMRSASVLIAVGLTTSIGTGVPLFAWRATAVVADATFQLKMLLLLAATVLHFALELPMSGRASAHGAAMRATGAFGLALWLGLAVAGCAFILLE